MSSEAAFLLPFVLAAFPGVAAYYAAAAAASRLADEYQESMARLRTREELEARLRSANLAEEGAKSRQAQALVELTRSTPQDDATAAFVLNAVHRLLSRAEALAQPDPSVIQDCRHLCSEIEENPDESPTHLKDYYRLSRVITGLSTRQAVTMAPNSDRFTDEFAALREMLASPLFTAQDAAKMREDLGAKLGHLEATAARQPKIVEQSLTTMRARVEREIARQSDVIELRIKARREFRELFTDTVSKLQAVAALEAIPESSAEAAALLSDLGTQLARAREPLPVLRNLSRKAGRLFDSVQQELNGRIADGRVHADAAVAYVRQQVTDVLLSLGYTVTQVPSDEADTSQAGLAKVSSDWGMQFSVDGQGRLLSEMVAFSDDAREVAKSAEDQACALLDQVLGRLGDRGCTVTEKVRRRHGAGHRLRVVRGQRRDGAVSAVGREVRRREVTRE